MICRAQKITDDDLLCIQMMSLVDCDGYVRGNEDWYLDLLGGPEAAARYPRLPIRVEPDTRLGRCFLASLTLLTVSGILPTRSPDEPNAAEDDGATGAELETGSSLWLEDPHEGLVHENWRDDLGAIIVHHFLEPEGPGDPPELTQLAATVAGLEPTEALQEVARFLASVGELPLPFSMVRSALNLVSRAANPVDAPPLVIRCSTPKCRRLFFLTNRRWRHCEFHRAGHREHKSSTAVGDRRKGRRRKDSEGFDEARNQAERARYAAKQGDRPIRQYTKRPQVEVELPAWQELPPVVSPRSRRKKSPLAELFDELEKETGLTHPTLQQLPPRSKKRAQKRPT